MWEWNEILAIVVKGLALWVIWESGKSIKALVRVQQPADLDQLVDCLDKLRRLSNEMAGSEQKKGEVRTLKKAANDES